MPLIHKPDQYRLRPTGPGPVLDVGCGSAKYPGTLGIDISADTDADIVHDLGVYPWPLQDDMFDQDIIEHISGAVSLHGRDPPCIATRRVCEAVNSALQLGARVWGSNTRALLLADGDSHLRKTIVCALHQRPLQSGRIRLDFWDPWRWLGIARLANRFVGVYEMLFAYWFSAMNICAELEVVKRP